MFGYLAMTAGLLAAIIIALMKASGHGVGIGSFVLIEGAWLGESNLRLNEFVFYLLQVNIFWGVMNLMPIIPLDGGHIADEILTPQKMFTCNK